PRHLQTNRVSGTRPSLDGDRGPRSYSPDRASEGGQGGREKNSRRALCPDGAPLSGEAPGSECRLYFLGRGRLVVTPGLETASHEALTTSGRTTDENDLHCPLHGQTADGAAAETAPGTWISHHEGNPRAADSLAGSPDRSTRFRGPQTHQAKHPAHRRR